MDWDKYRLCSVGNHLNDLLVSLRLDLLRYGYLIKANLDDSISCALVDVGYHLGSEVDDVSVVLYFGKELLDIGVDELCYHIYNVAGSRVVVYCDDDVDVVLFVSVFSE